MKRAAEMKEGRPGRVDLGVPHLGYLLTSRREMPGQTLQHQDEENETDSDFRMNLKSLEIPKVPRSRSKWWVGASVRP